MPSHESPRSQRPFGHPDNPPAPSADAMPVPPAGEHPESRPTPPHPLPEHSTTRGVPGPFGSVPSRPDRTPGGTVYGSRGVPILDPSARTANSPATPAEAGRADAAPTPPDGEEKKGWWGRRTRKQKWAIGIGGGVLVLCGIGSLVNGSDNAENTPAGVTANTGSGVSNGGNTAVSEPEPFPQENPVDKAAKERANARSCKAGVVLRSMLDDTLGATNNGNPEAGIRPDACVTSYSVTTSKKDRILTPNKGDIYLSFRCERPLGKKAPKDAAAAFEIFDEENGKTTQDAAEWFVYTDAATAQLINPDKTMPECKSLDQANGISTGSTKPTPSPFD